LSHYCASKSAVATFTEALTGELDIFGCKVISVEPWFYKTPMVDNHRIIKGIKRHFDGSTDEVKESYANSIDQSLRFSSLICSPPFASPKTDDVIDALVDAIRSIEPQPKMVVATTTMRPIVWFFFEFLPRDILYSVVSFAKRIELRLHQHNKSK